MKKKDLKNGMIIETRAGYTGLIIKDNVYGEDAVIFGENNGWTGLKGFNEDMKWSIESQTSEKGSVSDHCKSVDIVKVFKPDLPTGFLSRNNNFSDELTLLWERKEEVIEEFTMEELACKFCEKHLAE